ncbi:MAG: WG repeat-containing protein [Clostridiales Family XIII bacterium]|nr:WG repeat-containing protein [Clostridiales Family XIII bacterium]
MRVVHGFIARKFRKGFIDRNGDAAIPARFAEVGFYGFSEGLAAAKDAESGLWGFIDRSGEYVIPPSYSKQPGSH